MDYDLEEPLTSTVRPATRAIITIRIIKSFPYRNVKNYVIHDLDLTTTTVSELLKQTSQMIQSSGAYRPYRTVDYDTLKIYTKAHHSKTMNLIINIEDDDETTILKNESKTLADYGVENETELSMFNYHDYIEFKKNPVEKW